jgi:hypothetical protein
MNQPFCTGRSPLHRQVAALHAVHRDDVPDDDLRALAVGGEQLVTQFLGAASDACEVARIDLANRLRRPFPTTREAHPKA